MLYVVVSLKTETYNSPYESEWEKIPVVHGVSANEEVAKNAAKRYNEMHGYESYSSKAASVYPANELENL